MWTYEVVKISLAIFILFIICAYLFGKPSSPKTSGGKALKKATTAALNMDLIKSVYKKIKG
jgi:hypothetical protein